MFQQYNLYQLTNTISDNKTPIQLMPAKSIQPKSWRKYDLPVEKVMYANQENEMCDLTGGRRVVRKISGRILRMKMDFRLLYIVR